MLYLFQKYTISAPINKFICIPIANHRKPLKKFPNRYSKVVISSTFFRKSHYRSLLLYINFIYANFFLPQDANYFYLNTYLTVFYSCEHPSFFFRSILIKN